MWKNTPSVLGLGSFTVSYCISVEWRGGDQLVPLLEYFWSPGRFDRGLRLVCIFYSSCKLAGQSGTSANHLVAVFGAVGRC